MSTRRPRGPGRPSAQAATGRSRVWSDELLTVAICGALAITPWLQGTSFADPQSAPKALVIMLAAAACVPCLALGAAGSRPQNWWATAGIVLFAAATVVAWAFSVDRRESVFGWYGQRFGVVTLASLLVIGAGAVRVVAVGRTRSLLLAAGAGVAGAVLVAVLQASEAAGFFVDTRYSGKVNGGVGTGNDLAALAIGGIAVMAAMRSKRSSRWVELAAAAALAGLTTLAVLLGLSRVGAAIFGLAVLGVAGISWLRAGRDWRMPAAILAGVLVFAGVSEAWQAPEELAGRVTHQASPSGTALGSQGELAVSGSVRFEVWRGALALAGGRPLGAGPDAMALVFGQYRPRNAPGLEALADQQVGSASNLLLDVAASEGIVGAAGAVAVLIGAGAATLLAVRRRDYDLMLVAVGFWAAIAYEMLNPPNLAVALLLTCLLAMLVGLPATGFVLSKRLRIGLGGAAVVLSLALLLAAGALWRAELAAGRARAAYEAQDYATAEAEWSEAASRLGLERRYPASQLLAIVAQSSTTDAPSRENLSRVVAAGTKLRERFVPLAAELLVEARARYLLNHQDPEVQRLIDELERRQSQSERWRQRAEGVRRTN